MNLNDHTIANFVKKYLALFKQWSFELPIQMYIIEYPSKQKNSIGFNLCTVTTIGGLFLRAEAKEALKIWVGKQ